MKMDISSDSSNYCDKICTLTADLIGLWRALDADDEPAVLQFLSEDQVLVKSSITGSEAPVKEYAYYLERGNQIIFGSEALIRTVSFALSTDSSGSKFLKIDYGEGNEVVYERVDKTVNT